MRYNRIYSNQWASFKYCTDYKTLKEL